MDTKQAIVRHTATLLAHQGVAGTSMRKVAAAVGKEPSVLYSHFADKEALLRATRQYITAELDRRMQHLPTQATAPDRLRVSLRFQIEHRELIVALLQYFMAVRTDFVRTGDGYVPSRAYQHMTAIISHGTAEGSYVSANPELDAKMATHLVNGFLLEYFDRMMDDAECERLVSGIADFIERALGRGEK